MAPGGDGVDGDAARAELLGEIAGEDFDGALHGCVGGAAGIGEAGEAGGDVDDAAPVIDEGEKFLSEEEDAFEVDVIDGVEFVFGGFFDGGVVGGSGVVDEIVEAVGAKLLEGAAELFDEGVEGAGVAGVELEGDGFGSGVEGSGGDLVGFGTIGVEGKDGADAAPGEMEDGVAAEAAGASGDDGDFLGGGFIRGHGRLDAEGWWGIRGERGWGEWGLSRAQC